MDGRNDDKSRMQAMYEYLRCEALIALGRFKEARALAMVGTLPKP